MHYNSEWRVLGNVFIIEWLLFWNWCGSVIKVTLGSAQLWGGSGFDCRQSDLLVCVLNVQMALTSS